MTDRAKAFLVHLDDDYRIGDGDSGADRIADAIRMVKGVAKVEPMVADGEFYIAVERARRQLLDKLFEVLK